MFDRCGRGRSRGSAEVRARRYSIREMGSMHFEVELRFLVLHVGQVPLPLPPSLRRCAGMLHFTSGKGQYSVERDPGWCCGLAFCRARSLSPGEFGEAVGLILHHPMGCTEWGCCAWSFPGLANCILLCKTVLCYQFLRCKCSF